MKYLDSLLFTRHDDGVTFVYWKGIEVTTIQNRILTFLDRTTESERQQVIDYLELYIP